MREQGKYKTVQFSKFANKKMAHTIFFSAYHRLYTNASVSVYQTFGYTLNTTLNNAILIYYFKLLDFI